MCVCAFVCGGQQTGVHGLAAHLSVASRLCWLETTNLFWGEHVFFLKFKMFVDGTVRGTTCMPQLWRRWELLIACRRTVHMPAVRSDLNVRRQVSKRGAVKRAVNRAVSGRCADDKPTQACLIHCTTDSTLVGVAKRKKQRGRSAADASTRSTALASRN